MYAATPRVLITGWLDGVSLSALLDGRMDLLPEGWRELSPGDAADLAARLLGHAIYAPAACTGWMHADLHPGNFLLLPGRPAGHAGLRGGRRHARRHPGAVRAARRGGARRRRPDGGAAGPPGRRARPGPSWTRAWLSSCCIPIVATAAADTFTYSRPWLRGLMAHFTEPRFAPALRNLTPPREYALVWRATLSAAGLYAQLGATVPTRGFQLAYSPGFRDSVRGGQADSSARAGTGRTP